ncbi:MAG TPA: hypothetical protein VK652_01060 [Steroidobacteraceae bacterium]|nr:hypothetical protein [Steroidobacteraceae bacterium]
MIDSNIFFLIAMATAVVIAFVIKWPEIRDAGKPEREARAEMKRQMKRHYDETYGREPDRRL